MNHPHRPRHAPSIAQFQDFEAAFDRCFGLVTFQMNRHFIDHLLRVGRQTGDDYEAMLIWGVMAHQNVAHLLPPGSDPTSVLNERGRLPSPGAKRPLRLRDLAQITRIPRETVRRKLEKLEQAGWIVREDDGWLSSFDRSDKLLRETSREHVRRFLNAADEMMRTLHEADARVAAERQAARNAPDTSGA